jgi:16S rRNA (cytosine967-C5)-methyltransferase
VRSLGKADQGDQGPSIDHQLHPAELAQKIAEIAARAERAAFSDHRRPEPIVSEALKGLRGLSIADRLFVSRSIDALFRWWGWIEPLRLGPVEARLLVAVLLDRADVPEPCRAWARSIGVDPRCLVPVGGAPNWGRRAEAFRRLVEKPKASTEPWSLFPRWLREELLEPPGGAPIKHRLADLLQTLQRPSIPWVRAARGRPSQLWAELREEGADPKPHPRLTDVASLDPSTILQGLDAFRRGDLVSQDLSSVAVIASCDAEPSERWWYAGNARGEKALLLADRMGGKGTLVVAELEHRDRLRTARMTRKGPHTNVSTRPWDGRHVVGKPGTYHGVLLEPPSSGIGLWRRDPASRWFVDPTRLEALASQQALLLRIAALGVRQSGVLVYAVPSLARSETEAQIDRFLESHPGFQLDPFPDPIDGTPTEGKAILWPDRSDSDAWFVARLIRTRQDSFAPGAPGPGPSPGDA